MTLTSAVVVQEVVTFCFFKYALLLLLLQMSFLGDRKLNDPSIAICSTCGVYT